MTITLRELSRREEKAGKDKTRSGGTTMTTNETGVVPAVTKAALPQLSDQALARTDSLAQQLNNTGVFERFNTWARGGDGATVCRVSPLQNLSLAEYVDSATALRDHLGVNTTFLIKACTVILKEGGHLPLKELWRRAGGPQSVSSGAQKMIDLLMRAPLVAVRIGAGNETDGSWVVVAKEDDVNYGRLGLLLLAIEKPVSFLTTKTISKERLRALKRLASTTADRKLIELAALDQVSQRTVRKLSGRWHETAADKEELEHQIHVSLETFAAYEELARLDTISEINARIGTEITDAALRAEMEKLQQNEEKLEEEEEAAMVVELLPGVRYDEEQVGHAHGSHRVVRLWKCGGAG